MPSFDTPEPIVVTLEVGVGTIEIAASDRTDTTVEVLPTNPSRTRDVTAAASTRVDFANGRLSVRAPKGWRNYTFRGISESIAVKIGVPAGSRLEGESAVAGLFTTGRLGDVRFRAGVGDVHLDEVGALNVRSGAGDMTVNRVDGPADLSTGSGSAHAVHVAGTCTIKNANGATSVGEVGGDLRISAANGSITVGVARGSVVTKTAYGDITIGEVGAGSATAATAYGNLEVGIRPGVAAWLDLDTKFGTLTQTLDQAGAPVPGEPQVQVQAHTAYGNISVHRTAGRPQGVQA